MNLKVLHLAICRTPAFALTDTLEERWDDLKHSVSESSPAFYQLITDKTVEQLALGTEKLNFSVWKYFNRSKFRATPYGHFAGVSAVAVYEDADGIKLTSGLQSVVFRDWQEKDDCFNKDNSGLSDVTSFRANSSIYNIGDELRYIRFVNSQFQLESITATKQLIELIKACEEPKTTQQLLTVLREQLKVSKNSCEQIIWQLVKNEILITDRTPNIIGDDYFNRIKYYLPFQINPYVNCLRPVLHGGVNLQSTKQLSELTGFLSTVLPDVEKSELAAFRSAFLKKFDQQIVPLALVMDPETGIGYGQLEQSETDERFAAIFNSTKPIQKAVSQIPYDTLHHFLLKGIIDKGEIRLEKFRYETGKKQALIPNSISLIAHFWNNHPVIESIGGCTANSLLGRFTIANEDIYDMGRGIVDLEEIANPGVIFFDIGYQAEKSVDNVNRRQQLYHYELPILSWSTNQATISINDILVFVKNDEIVLWSKKYSKRIIPRIASAYNYTRSDLAVYRFLCDLQHQGIKSNLNFKLQNFFPHLEYYPRVFYKTIILSPAMWKIPQQVLEAPPKNLNYALRIWLNSAGVCFPFKIGDTDQTLCFDPSVDADIWALALYCQQHSSKAIYITEALVANNKVTNENDKHYAAQFIFNLAHTEQIYHPYKYIKQLIPKQESPIIFPGNDWIYFEIYCHPIRSNQLLIQKLRYYIRDTNKDLHNWFFIRYDDPKPHIRLRIQIKEISKGYTFINKLNILLTDERISGLVADIQIKTYFPETTRYGANRMASVEKLFNIDSNYAIALIKCYEKTEDIHHIAIRFILNLLSLCLGSVAQQIAFSKMMANSFSAEFGLGSDSFKSINQYFKQFDFDKEAVPHSLIKLSNRYLKLAGTIFDNCGENERSNMLADMIHMHINRLFISDQRQHEAILYHFLAKVLQKQFTLSTGSKE